MFFYAPVRLIFVSNQTTITQGFNELLLHLVDRLQSPFVEAIFFAEVSEL